MFGPIDPIINNLTSYDLVSGWIPCATVFVGVVGAFRRWNCNEPRCWRHGYPHAEHGRPVCNIHYHSHDPGLGIPSPKQGDPNKSKEVRNEGYRSN